VPDKQEFPGGYANRVATSQLKIFNAHTDQTITRRDTEMV
jgi:hypothetical protein